MLTELFKNAEFGLSQIYTPVFHLWKSVALDNAWNRDSRPFIFFSIACFCEFRDAPQSCFWCRGSQTMLMGLFKNASFGPPPLGRFPGTWAIFPSSRDSKLIREDFAFQ